MKHLLSGAIGAMIMALVMWLTMGEQSDCRSIQASYERTQALYEQRIAQQDDLIQYALARISLGHAQQKTLLLSRVALQKKPQTIEQLAAKVAPIERAIKQEATDNHEFIPAALRGYWGKVLQYGLTKGK